MQNLSISLHIAFGSIAMLIGLWQLLSIKGSKAHKRRGQLFVLCYAVVIGTAVVGSVFFNFRPFLVVLTATSLYSAVSGMRALYLRGARPAWFDNVYGLVNLAFVVGFYSKISVLPLIMPKVTVYATLGSLTVYLVYDLLKNYLSSGYLQRTWPIEHGIKMICAWGALLSAAAGNLMPSMGSVAQLAPSVLTGMLIVWVVYLQYQASARSQKVVDHENRSFNPKAK